MFLRFEGSSTSLATPLTLAIGVSSNGIQRGTLTRWQVVAHDGTGAPTLTEMGGVLRHRDGWGADRVRRGTA